MKTLKICLGQLLVLCQFLETALAEQPCLKDGDCNHLGDLVCVKYGCEWGRCDCRHGSVAKFTSSSNRYSCVPLKKVGEYCSTCGSDGLCGAPNSECNTEKGICECRSGYVATVCGQYCSSQRERWIGESCDKGTSCSSGICSSGVFNTPPQCICSQGEHLVLTNDITTDRFLGGTYPKCIKNKVGDFCIKDNDCKNVNDGVCRENKCACRDPDSVPDIAGFTCGTALGKGDNCTNEYGTPLGGGVICDWTRGLTCGNPCALKSTYPKQCMCSLQHTDAGSACIPRKIGDACYGDNNCKGISPRGLCIDGKCSGAGFVRASMFAVLLSLLTTVKFF